MAIIYSGSLPQNAIVIHERNPEYTYSLAASKTACFAFKLRRNTTQIIVELSDTTPFQNCFIPVLRSWASVEPVGVSLTSSPRSSQTTINLSPIGLKYNFWLVTEVTPDQLVESSVNHPIEDDTQYWMNIQNLQNKPSFFFCKFTYIGKNMNYSE